jgi:Xaa-Pro aminopeptidase
VVLRPAIELFSSAFDSRGVTPSKRTRLDAMLADRGLEAVWFARPNAFAWLTGGDNVVDRHAPVGTAAAGYDGDGVTVVTDTIEGPRLRAEELPDDVRLVTVPWYESSLAAAVAEHSPAPAGADFDVPGFERVDGSDLRQPLTPDDRATYRTLGRETAAAVEATCREVGPDTTERETAADVRRALASRGIDAPVVLVGGGDRAPKYRHYTPQDVPLGAYALVSVTACRAGLYASCTRTVAFDAPAWLEERHATAMRVETTALAATRSAGRAGGTAGDVFAALRDAYAAGGVPDEWREHHQGGAAGYAGREWIATPDSDAPVTLPMAYAWNPTVQGAKSEDTVVVDDGFEVLTDTGEWPTRTAEAVGFDVALPRPAVLVR